MIRPGRLAGAITAVKQAIDAATDSKIPASKIGDDDDLMLELCMDELELESLTMMLETVFSVPVGMFLWQTPRYRSPAGIAEWCIKRSDEAAWAAAKTSSTSQRRWG